MIRGSKASINESLIRSGREDFSPDFIRNSPHFLEIKYFPETNNIFAESLHPSSLQNGVPPNGATSLNFNDEKDKIFISVESGMYHGIFEQIPQIITMLKNNDCDFIFYLMSCDITMNGYADFICEFIKFANSTLGHGDSRIHFIRHTNAQYIELNNFATDYIYDLSCSEDEIAYAMDMLSRYAGYSPDHGIRKVYLYRQDRYARDYSHLHNGSKNIKFLKDVRMLDDEVLRDRLVKDGFYLVSPEDAFESIREQARFFSHVDTIASVTSSGLANASFMKPGSTVIEFVTPHVGGHIDGAYDEMCIEESIHLLYQPMSYILGHRHISIPNKTRMSKDIIEQMESMNIVQKILEQDTQ